MTKADLVEKVQSATGFTLKESADLLESVMDIIKDTLARGEDLKISRFGNFELRAKSLRRGRNPQTGAELTIAARRVLSFKPSAVLKQAINQPQR